MGLFGKKSKERQDAGGAAPPAAGDEIHLSVDEEKLNGDADGLLDVVRSGSDPEERSKAAWALVEMGDERAEQTLIAIVGDDRETSLVRFQAIGALGKMHARQAVEPLVEVLTDAAEEDKVRAGAAVSLGWIGDAQASEPLAEVWLRAGDERLQDAAGRAFMELEVPTSDVLVKALDDPECCEEAAERLGRFADASAVPALEAAAERARERKAKRLAKAAEAAIDSIRHRAA